MLNDLLLSVLTSLTPEEKEIVRDTLEKKAKEETEKVEETKEPETQSESETTGTEKTQGENKDMPENKDIKEEKTEEKVEETKKEEVSSEKVPETTEKTAENAENTENSAENTQETQEPQGQAQVQTVEPSGNGVRIEDLVTKDELQARFDALAAKFDAVIKENQDLKDKYENKDFGNFQKQGTPEKNKDVQDSFDSYAKNFM